MNEYETRQFWDLKPTHDYPIWNVQYNDKKESFTYSLNFDIYNYPIIEQWSKECNKNLIFKCNER